MLFVNPVLTPPFGISPTGHTKVTVPVSNFLRFGAIQNYSKYSHLSVAMALKCFCTQGTNSSRKFDKRLLHAECTCLLRHFFIHACTSCSCDTSTKCCHCPPTPHCHNFFVLFLPIREMLQNKKLLQIKLLEIKLLAIKLLEIK